MDGAASGISLAAFGIQLCQGLVAYYEDWKSCGNDISSTYESIASVGETFSLLRNTLERGVVDKNRSIRVEECLKSCEGSLNALQNKLKKLQSCSVPGGFRKKAWSKLQRLYYPFQARTLRELKNTTSELQGNLGTALEVLHLDLSISTYGVLSSVERGVSKVGAQTAALKDSTSRLAAQCQVTSDGVQDLLTRQQVLRFGKIVDWLSPADPWTNYDEARTKLKVKSGAWLMQLDQYLQWKAANVQRIWLSGKSGCGKSVLCSIVIEDIRKHCAQINAGFAMFYFTFSDTAKQSYRDLLLSLVAQLCWKEPGCTRLQRAFENSDRSVLTTDSLEEILLSSLARFDKVYTVIDGLDECPEHDETRATMLARLEKLAGIAQNIYLLVTSQPLPEIKFSMSSMGVLSINIERDLTDADIRQYVESELSNNSKLRSLDSTTKGLVRDTIVQKADGSFRWADCQLGELKQLKSTKPRHITAALNTLPRTLHATYERMLVRIDESVQQEALIALRWLAFAVRPLTLAELVDACITDPIGQGSVDLDERGGLEDVLDVLSGLVIVDYTEQSRSDISVAQDVDDAYVQHIAPAEFDFDLVAFSDTNPDSDNSDDSGTYSSSLETRQAGRIRGIAEERDHALKMNHRIRLAHFSVKEFLLSARICESEARSFALQEGREQAFLAHSCITYLMCYSDRSERRATRKVRADFPLARYAAKSWYHHSSLKVSYDTSREVHLLTTNQYRRDWLRLDMPHRLLVARLGYHNLQTASDFAMAIYCASSLGLELVVRTLYSGSFATGDLRGRDDNALLVASTLGFEKVVETLLEHGAYVDAHAGFADSPLAAALYGEHEKVVDILLRNGAGITALTDHRCSALQLAAGRNNEKNIRLLLKFGAEVNAPFSIVGSALIAAIRADKDRIVDILLDNGADIHARGAGAGNALEEAAYHGNAKLVNILLEKGADVNAFGEPYGDALQAAIKGQQPEIAETLLLQGADAFVERENRSESALEFAGKCGYEKIVDLMLNHGANANIDTIAPAVHALIFAAEGGHKKTVERLLKHCGHVVASGASYGSALIAASCGPSRDVVDMILTNGANVEPDGVTDYKSTALRYAASHGRESVVRALFRAGADVNATGDGYGSALQAATARGYKRIVEILLDNGAEACLRGGIYGNALHAALCYHREWIVSKLVGRGAVFDTGALREAIERQRQSPNNPSTLKRLLDLQVSYDAAEKFLPADTSTLDRLMAVCGTYKPKHSN